MDAVQVRSETTKVPQPARTTIMVLQTAGGGSQAIFSVPERCEHDIVWGGLLDHLNLQTGDADCDEHVYPAVATPVPAFESESRAHDHEPADLPSWVLLTPGPVSEGITPIIYEPADSESASLAPTADVVLEPDSEQPQSYGPSGAEACLWPEAGEPAGQLAPSSSDPSPGRRSWTEILDREIGPISAPEVEETEFSDPSSDGVDDIAVHDSQASQ